MNFLKLDTFSWKSVQQFIGHLIYSVRRRPSTMKHFKISSWKQYHQFFNFKNLQSSFEFTCFRFKKKFIFTQKFMVYIAFHKLRFRDLFTKYSLIWWVQSCDYKLSLLARFVLNCTYTSANGQRETVAKTAPKK